MKQEISESIKSWILRVRLGMIGLNDVIWRNETSRLCSLCNLNENENIVHFIGVCPMYKNYRKHYLGKNYLNFIEVKNALNGSCSWSNFKFLSKSWSY